HHTHPWRIRGSGAELYALSNWILIGPETASRSLINNDHSVFRSVIVFGKEPPLGELGLDYLEVIRGYAADLCCHVRRRLLRTSFNRKQDTERGPGHREVGSDGRHLDAR